MTRRTDRWRVRVAQAYGIATRGALDELAPFANDELLGALDIAETSGVLSGPHLEAQQHLRSEIRRRTTMQ